MYIAFYAIELVVLFILMILAFVRESGMFAMFPLIGGVIGLIFTGQLASDGSIITAYQGDGTPITALAYPPILILAVLSLLSFALVMYKATVARKRGHYTAASLMLKIALICILIGVAAWELPGALNTIDAANLGDAGLTALMAQFSTIMAFAAYFAYIYTIMIEN